MAFLSSLWKGMLILYKMATQVVVSAFFGTLVKQVNSLKDQLWMVNLRMELQSQRVQELLAELEQKEKDNKPLWERVEYLTNQLQTERNETKTEGKLRREEAAKCLAEERRRAGARQKHKREDLLKDIKLFQIKSRDNQKRLEKEVEAKAAQLDASRERGRRLHQTLRMERATVAHFETTLHFDLQ
ncbi:uncharacterized protein LOC133498170 [Syngnathoides biaculeatus]|uniref:uncharacterized protein LOC133498170 n=1 Tax=Syngnathoides biaculeatus TaxID=300417 RepID=UPI002ADD43EB|nr:uncharacterized protein LOC133498170 [Syngnathoides biaculeatus]